jgi:nucleoside deoxyribosyltransferase
MTKFGNGLIPQVYLAGPTIFRRDAILRGQELQAHCTSLNVTGLYPFDNQLPKALKGAEAARWVYEADIAQMDKADAGVFDISPFRGPHADPGTCFEMGYMTAKGKPCVAYSSAWRTEIETMDLRVKLWSQRTKPRSWDEQARSELDGVPRDHNGDMIEGFGETENCMVTMPSLGMHRTAEEALNALAWHLWNN